jgi:hypothetical protein
VIPISNNSFNDSRLTFFRAYLITILECLDCDKFSSRNNIMLCGEYIKKEGFPGQLCWPFFLNIYWHDTRQILIASDIMCNLKEEGHQFQVCFVVWTSLNPSWLYSACSDKTKSTSFYSNTMLEIRMYLLIRPLN